MTMNLTTVQWNIGGGRIRGINDDATTTDSYCQNGIEYIISFLKTIDPDIITLQEIHKNDSKDQAEEIASRLGLKYYISDFYADSHIEAGQKLGQAIISRYIISNRRFELFVNPQYEITWEDGGVASSHDKGVLSADIDVNGTVIHTITTHLIPFRRFDIDPISNDAHDVVEDIQEKLQTSAKTVLVQGDFNFNFEALRPILPKLFKDGMDEVLQTNYTTPKKRRYDHILFRGIKIKESSVDDSLLTDHYPIITHFDI